MKGSEGVCLHLLFKIRKTKSNRNVELLSVIFNVIHILEDGKFFDTFSCCCVNWRNLRKSRLLLLFAFFFIRFNVSLRVRHSSLRIDFEKFFSIVEKSHFTEKQKLRSLNFEQNGNCKQLVNKLESKIANK